ncbi:hypothetical protein CRUP_007674 [Coryphaenoides rupestris]|nr:hypothetical protein CRUP_007674 [Coryphaenoides rupestris]
MPRFQELEADRLSHAAAPDRMVAKRYRVMQRLGRGSFGRVYLVTDSRAGDGEQLKVLKEIPLGDLRPNETVQASQEAQLLSRLHHPHILRFFHSFLEHDTFCIITEYCQDKDLDYKLGEVRESGRSLSETQVIDWLVQLLLGVHYMHDRRILHRDLKAKNVFLKRNLVKIGHPGVSQACPRVETGVAGRALGCILYEMCCLSHPFEAPSFLSVVVKIVEGPTPALPPTYSPDLSSVMHRHLAEEKYREVSARRRELRTRHFETLSLDIFTERVEGTRQPSQPIAAKDGPLLGASEPMRVQPAEDTCVPEQGAHGIPVDPQTAEFYYEQEEFESCSDEEEDDLEAVMRQMEMVLGGDAGGDAGSELGAPSVSSEGRDPQDLPGPPRRLDPLGSQDMTGVHSSLVETRIQHMRDRLGEEVFQRLYEDLKEARQRGEGDDRVLDTLDSSSQGSF